MALVVVTSDRFVEHLTPPGHPERRERAEVMQVVTARWRQRGGTVLEPRPASDEELARVHDGAYLAALAETRGRATMLDPDTFTSPESEAIARLAAGAVVTAVDHVLGGEGRRAMVLARPPGHHAERDRAMGFCLYNSIAVGAAAARAAGASRVAIVDYDVHHGNGTQAMFYDDPAVLFVSSHQYPFYPGTGAATEVGTGAGVGHTVNLPLEVGATDADFDLVYRTAVIPLLEYVRPELLLISAGFDAHERDPLAGMRMTTAGFGQITARLLRAADAVSGGRVVLVTEGGYDLAALGECCQHIIDVAAGDPVPAVSDLAGETRRGDETLAAFRRAHRRAGR